MKVFEYRKKHPNCEYCEHRFMGFDKCIATQKAIRPMTARKCPCYKPKKWSFDNTCVCCGTVIPEGRQVCRRCEENAEEG